MSARVVRLPNPDVPVTTLHRLVLGSRPTEVRVSVLLPTLMVQRAISAREVRARAAGQTARLVPVPVSRNCVPQFAGLGPTLIVHGAPAASHRASRAIGNRTLCALARLGRPHLGQWISVLVPSLVMLPAPFPREHSPRAVVDRTGTIGHVDSNQSATPRGCSRTRRGLLRSFYRVNFPARPGSRRLP